MNYFIMGVVVRKTCVFRGETDKVEEKEDVYIRGYSGSGYGSGTGHYR